MESQQNRTELVTRPEIYHQSHVTPGQTVSAQYSYAHSFDYAPVQGTYVSPSVAQTLSLPVVAAPETQEDVQPVVAEVWPTTQFQSFSISDNNSLICHEGKSMTPLWGHTFLFRSCQQLPRLRLGLLKGFLS